MNIPIEDIEGVDHDSSVELFYLNTRETELGIEELINQKITIIQEQNEFVSTTILRELKLLLYKHQDIFSENPGKLRDFSYRLKITNKTPYFIRPYPIALPLQCPCIAFAIPKCTHEKEGVRRELERMLQNGKIQKSQGNYINPIVIVTKL